MSRAFALFQPSSRIIYCSLLISLLSKAFTKSYKRVLRLNTITITIIALKIRIVRVAANLFYSIYYRSSRTHSFTLSLVEYPI